MTSKYYSLLILLVLAFFPLPVLAVTIYTVTTNAGDTSAGSLGAALNSAAGEGASTSDLINFGSYFDVPHPIVLSASYPSVTKNAGTTLRVVSPGLNNVFLNGSSSNYTIFDFGGGGTLQLSNLQLQQGTINIGTGSVLELDTVRDFPGSVTVTGGGGLLVDGGFVYLGGHNDFTGGITVTNGATLQANTSSLGDAAATITLDGGALGQGLQGLALEQTVTITANGGTISAYLVDGDILGSNGVSFAGGPITLIGAKSYTGNTWVNNATLVLTQSGGLGSGPSTLFLKDGGLGSTASVTLSQAIDLANNVTLNGSYRDNVLNGVLSGTGDLTVDNGGNQGSWTLTTASTYAGSTTLTGGTLALSGNGTLGAGGLVLGTNGTFDIGAASAPVTVVSVNGTGTINVGSNQLTVGLDDSNMTFSGNLYGSGNFIKAGTGTLTLDSSNGFNGNFIMGAGRVLVEDPVGLGFGSVTLLGGTLEFFGGAQIFQIDGNYSQAAPVTLRMTLDEFAYQRLQIFGSAQLGGTLQVFRTGISDPFPGQSFLLMQANGGINGRFDSVVNYFPNVRILPAYYSNQVVLVAVVPSFAQLAVTPNQKAVATALDGAFGKSGTQDLEVAMGIQASSALPASYDQVAPTGLLPVFQMGFETARAQADLLSRRFSEGNPDNEPSRLSRWGKDEVLFASTLPAKKEAQIQSRVAPVSGWDLFLERQSVSSSLSGDSNSPGYQFVSSGFTAGMENHLSKEMSLGLLLAYGQSNTVPGGTGSVNATGGQAGLYGGWRSKGVYLELSGIAGLNNYSTQRQGFGGYATGATSGYQLSGQMALGFDQDLGPTQVGLFGSGQYSYVAVDAFQETGSLAPLAFSAQGERSLLSDLGARASRRFTLGDFTFKPGLSLAWEHRYEGSANSLSAAFTGGDSFTTEGPAAWTDGISAGARLGVQVAQALDLSFQYQDLVAFGNGGSQAFSGGVNFGF